MELVKDGIGYLTIQAGIGGVSRDFKKPPMKLFEAGS